MAAGNRCPSSTDEEATACNFEQLEPAGLHAVPHGGVDPSWGIRESAGYRCDGGPIPIAKRVIDGILEPSQYAVARSVLAQNFQLPAKPPHADSGLPSLLIQAETAPV